NYYCAIWHSSASGFF
nr:immunoglobulin light chain junction region [Macaca mulatta]